MLLAAKIPFRVLLVIASWLFITTIRAGNQNLPPLIQKVFSYTERNQLKIGYFESDIYLKFHMENVRRNMAMHFIPFVGKQERGQRSYIGESALRFSYTAPGIIDQKEIAFTSTMPYLKNMRDLFLTNLNISIYEPTLLRDRILSPIHRKNQYYYDYLEEFTFDQDGESFCRLSIRSKVHNMQLVKGYMDIVVATGRIATLYCEYTYNATQHFTIKAEMGEDGLASLLPKKMEVSFNFKFLNNSSNIHIDALFKHSNIRPYNKQEVESLLAQSKHDLTSLYSLHTDTSSTLEGRPYFDLHRPIPLTTNEDSLYEAFQRTQSPTDTLLNGNTDEDEGIRLNVEDILLSSHYLHFGPKGRIRIPPIITPSMAEWSNRKGLSLRTKLQLRYENNKGHQFLTDVHLGYNFKRKEFYWKTPISYTFSPHHNGTIHFEVGNGNRIYNSAQAEDVREQLSKDYRYDSLLNVFNGYSFNYYHDFYSKLGSSYDPLPGLRLKLELVYHNRTLVEWNEEAEKNGLDHRIKSLAPRIYVEWTPSLYYRWQNNRPQPVFSHWPTLSAEYERGLRTASFSSSYDRWEFEAKYRMQLYALRQIYLRAGGGFFTNRHSTYFVDYSNFSYNSLPSTWSDKMNGQFESLDSRWYNESEYYVRACASYESPMLLFSNLRPLTQYIKKERVYCNLLSVHALNPYMEWGYSVATHLFDVGIFAGLANKKSLSIGWSFSLNLFND